jgi:hypothetical protein
VKRWSGIAAAAGGAFAAIVRQPGELDGALSEAFRRGVQLTLRRVPGVISHNAVSNGCAESRYLATGAACS